MSRTQGRSDSDTGYQDGIIDLAAGDFQVVTGAATLTRNALGDISLNQAASTTVVYSCPLSGLIYRTGVQDYLQETFGAGGSTYNPFGAQGLAVNQPTTYGTASPAASGKNVAINLAVQYSAMFAVGRYVAIDTGAMFEYCLIIAIPDATHITVDQTLFAHTSGYKIVQSPFTTPAGVTGAPPFTGISQFTVPSSRPKGIQFKGLEVRYQISTANLTSQTVGLTRTIFQNATALAVTNILTAAANGLATTFAATPYVTPVAIASPAYQTADLSEFILEMSVVTPASSTYKFYGVTLYVTFNYN